MTWHLGSVPAADVHRWKAEATQQLLGHTIGLDDDAWHAPTALPGWSRAHVATHLARNADHVCSILEAVRAGLPQPPAPSAAVRFADLEQGADRDGLALQIDLDTSAGALHRSIDITTDWTPPVILHGSTHPLAVLTLARFHEVCIHHLDLDVEFNPEVIDAAPAAWLLRWAVERAQDAALPALRIEGDSLVADLGRGGEPLVVRGSDIRLWAWLSGRGCASSVEGADGLAPALTT
ncbi:MAG: maleylpyruvate isomerase family mycothiol-dependent enzyme [Propionicimonas sp.]